MRHRYEVLQGWTNWGAGDCEVLGDCDGDICSKTNPTCVSVAGSKPSSGSTTSDRCADAALSRVMPGRLTSTLCHAQPLTRPSDASTSSTQSVLVRARIM